MSYNTLRVNNSEPTNNNIVFDLTSCLDQAPNNGEYLILQGGQWVSGSVGGEPPLDLENQVAIVHTGNNTYTNFGYYRYDRWAMPWSKNYMTHDLNTGSSLVNAYRPPSTITDSTFAQAVSLPAGKYLIRAVGSLYSGSLTFRLYSSTSTNGSASPQYHGNEVYMSYNLAKPGGMMCAVVDFATTRYLFIRNDTAGSASPLYLGLQHVTIQIRKINE